MKTLSIIGIILMICGLLLAIYGYELYANFVCNGRYCPSGEQAVPIGPLTMYTGIAITLGGIGFFVYSWRKLTTNAF